MPSTRLPVALAALTLAAACGAAHGQTVWHCWLDDQSIACSLLQHRAAAKDATRLAPLSPLQALRQQPGLLRGKLMRIPLHTVPFDSSALGELAQAVMCGAQPDCQAHYGQQMADTPERAAHFADAHDPLLQGGE